MERIKELVIENEYLNHANVVSNEWWEKILEEDQVENEDRGDALHAAVSLLCLLPT